jgi:hypothetical protein
LLDVLINLFPGIAGSLENLYKQELTAFLNPSAIPQDYSPMKLI